MEASGFFRSSLTGTDLHFQAYPALRAGLVSLGPSGTLLHHSIRPFFHSSIKLPDAFLTSISEPILRNSFVSDAP